MAITQSDILLAQSELAAMTAVRSQGGGFSELVELALLKLIAANVGGGGGVAVQPRQYSFTYQDISAGTGSIPAGTHAFSIVNLGPGNITLSSGGGTIPPGGSVPAATPGENNTFAAIPYTVPTGTTGKLAIVTPVP